MEKYDGLRPKDLKYTGELGVEVGDWRGDASGTRGDVGSLREVGGSEGAGALGAGGGRGCLRGRLDGRCPGS